MKFPLSETGERNELRLLKISGTDAGGAKPNRFHGSIVVDFDRLQIDLESTLGVLHHMHTDTAGLLGQTLAGDVTAIGFDFAAHRTNLAHFRLAIVKTVCISILTGA